MSILSSLLSLGQSKPVQQIPQTVTEPKIAEEVAPFIKDILGKGQALYKQRMEEGFVPFEGKTLADVTADQLAAQEGLRGLVGTQAGGLQEARDLVRRQTQEATAETLQPFMNPYQQAVTDIAKRQAQERFEQETLPGLRKQAIDAGAFGGSRAAMRESQAQDAQARLLADIQAKGDLAAFQDARQAFEAQKTRERQAAEGLSGLTGREFEARRAELGGLEAVGREQQQRQQQLLDESYQRFLQERAFPEKQLGAYQAIVQGASPLLGSSQITTAPQTFQPSPIASALGTAGTALGTYKTAQNLNLFGSSEGGPVIPAEEGTPGGLRGIMIKIIRAQRGKGGDPRSRRSEEIRTREQQEDVTRMLEDMDMKAGGLIDLPVVQREEGQQVLNLRKPYDDPEFVSQGERIAEKVQNLPGVIKDFLGSVLGPTEKQQQQAIELEGKINRMKSERAFAEAVRRGEADDLDTFRRKQAEAELMDEIKPQEGSVRFPFGEDPQPSIPNQLEADKTNIVPGDKTTSGETTGGETTGGKTASVDKIGTEVGALSKLSDAYTKYAKSLDTMKQKRLDNIDASRAARKSQAQIDFIMGISKGLLKGGTKGGLLADLTRGGEEGVEAVKTFQSDIDKLNREELDILDKNLQDNFALVTENINLAFKKGDITRAERDMLIKERRVAAEEAAVGLRSASTSLDTIADLVSKKESQQLSQSEFLNSIRQNLAEGIILPRHLSAEVRKLLGAEVPATDTSKTSSKLEDTGPDSIVSGI
jgi:hypothetical protein